VAKRVPNHYVRRQVPGPPLTLGGGGGGGGEGERRVTQEPEWGKTK